MQQSSDDLGRFAPVKRYYEERSRDRGDIYGWGAVQVEPRLIARLLADPAARDIPSNIEGIAITVMMVGRPEPM